jgi:hypothetical protein
MPAKTPEQARAYDAARRRSKRVKIRVTEDEAQRIRNVADGRARPVVDLAYVAEFSTPITALLAAPQVLRDLEADLGRLSDRLAHLFTTDYALPSEQRAEIQATLSEVRDVLRAIPPAIAALRAETEEPRAAIARLLEDVAAALDA